jgi:hypothetical protein
MALHAALIGEPSGVTRRVLAAFTRRLTPLGSPFSPTNPIPAELEQPQNSAMIFEFSLAIGNCPRTIAGC